MQRRERCYVCDVILQVRVFDAGRACVCVYRRCVQTGDGGRVCVVQGVQFDLDSPLTLRLEFARSNTKTTSTKPQQLQQQQPLAASSSTASSAKTTPGCGLQHSAPSAASVASLTGCELTDSRSLLCRTQRTN